jgi:hypothetical protein
VKQAGLSPQTLSLVMAVQTDLIMVTFFCSLAFVALFTLVAPWWRYPAGRSTVALDAALALTLLPSVVHHIFGFRSAEDPFFAWFTVGAFALVPCVIVWRAVIIVRMQRAGVKDPGQPPGL